jgi:hypothetical protein
VSGTPLSLTMESTTMESTMRLKKQYTALQVMEILENHDDNLDEYTLEKFLVGSHFIDENEEEENEEEENVTVDSLAKTSCDVDEVAVIHVSPIRGSEDFPEILVDSLPKPSSQVANDADVTSPIRGSIISSKLTPSSSTVYLEENAEVRVNTGRSGALSNIKYQVKYSLIFKHGDNFVFMSLYVYNAFFIRNLGGRNSYAELYTFFRALGCIMPGGFLILLVLTQLGE